MQRSCREAGFFFEFPIRRGGDFLGFLPGIIADQAGGKLENFHADRRPKLFDEKQIVLLSERENGDGGRAVGPSDIFPAIERNEFEKPSAVQTLLFGHDRGFQTAG